MTTINRKQALDLIHETNGKVFGVTFIKRSTGEERTMRCIVGTHTRKDLAGGAPAYDPTAHGLVWVYLMAGDVNRAEEKNRRSIPVDGIKELSIGGSHYRVV